MGHCWCEIIFVERVRERHEREGKRIGKTDRYKDKKGKRTRMAETCLGSVGYVKIIRRGSILKTCSRAHLGLSTSEGDLLSIY